MDLDLLNKTDEELISEINVNQEFFSYIIERYKDKLQRYILRLGCKNPSDIDDVLQEVFLKAFVNLNDFDTSLKFSSWIYRIAHNETINFFRKNKRQPLQFFSTEDEEFILNIKSDFDLFEHSSASFDSEIIKDSLNLIEEKYKDVLLLKFFEEKSYTEISDILKIPEGTVATYISRGKQQLKEKLAKLRNI